jgi:hypothetical protein
MQRYYEAWRVYALAAGCALVVPASTGLVLTGVPTLLCPMPFLTVTPAFILATPVSDLPYWIAVFVPSLLFFVWHTGLLRCQTQIPMRSWVLLPALTALSMLWFIEGWKYGIHYQGRQFTRYLCALNFLWLLLLWPCYIKVRVVIPSRVTCYSTGCCSRAELGMRSHI